MEIKVDIGGTIEKAEVVGAVMRIGDKAWATVRTLERGHYYTAVRGDGEWRA